MGWTSTNSAPLWYLMTANQTWNTSAKSTAVTSQRWWEPVTQRDQWWWTCASERSNPEVSFPRMALGFYVHILTKNNPIETHRIIYYFSTDVGSKIGVIIYCSVLFVVSWGENTQNCFFFTVAFSHRASIWQNFFFILLMLPQDSEIQQFKCCYLIHIITWKTGSKLLC